MKINFNQNSKLPDNQIKVDVSASHLSNDVISLLKILDRLKNHVDILPIKTNDRLVMLSLEDIIAIDVLKSCLTIYSTKNSYKTHGQLKAMISKINDQRFVQISKNSIINIDHLNYMEAGFSGNMTAFLSHNLKINVSRKYLSNLKQRLRI